MKKNFKNKLVSIHKLLLVTLLFSTGVSVSAQEEWSLDKCIDSALVYNKGIQIDRNNMAISDEKNAEVTSNLYPKIMANMEYKYFFDLPRQLMPLSVFNPQVPEGQFKAAQFGVPHNINANVFLSMPLYNPQVYGAVGNTEIAQQVTKLKYQKTKEDVVYDITIIYYNAQIVLNQLEFVSSNLSNAETLLAVTKLLNEQLLVKGTDVSKAELQKQILQTQKDKLESKYEEITSALKFAIGISDNRKIEVEANIAQEIKSKIVKQENLDLKLVKAQKELLSNELSTLQKSRYLPNLNLVASYGTTGFGYDKSPNEFLDFYPVSFAGLQLSVPLFDGTTTQRKIEQKKLEIENNKLQTKLVSDKNKMEIGNFERQKTIAAKSIMGTENQIELANTIYENTQLMQKKGTASITEVLLADNSLRESQQNYINAIIDYLKADLKLRKLSGKIHSENKNNENE